MKKFLFICLGVLSGILIFDYFKFPNVLYLPFWILGSQMAATVPPFGIFIESTYKNENPGDPCSILNHEYVHWNQYKELGLINFYFKYFGGFLSEGRITHEMEVEARKPCKNKMKVKMR